MQSTRLFAPATSLFKGIRVAPITTSQRFFSLTTSCQNEETKTPEAEQTIEAEVVVEEEEADPINLSRRRRRFHEWAHGSGAKYSRPAKGTTNYLGTTNVCSVCYKHVPTLTHSFLLFSLSLTTHYSNLDLLFPMFVVKKYTTLLNLIPKTGQFVSWLPSMVFH